MARRIPQESSFSQHETPLHGATHHHTVPYQVGKAPIDVVARLCRRLNVAVRSPPVGETLRVMPRHLAAVLNKKRKHVCELFETVRGGSLSTFRKSHVRSVRFSGLKLILSNLNSHHSSKSRFNFSQCCACSSSPGLPSVSLTSLTRLLHNNKYFRSN